MLEESPMGAATQESLTHGNESSKVYDGVGSEVVELCPKEVQKPSKERLRRQGKSTVDVGGKENALTLPRLRLGFLPRKPRRSMGDQSFIGQVVKIFMTDGQEDPVALDPALRQASS